MCQQSDKLQLCTCKPGEKAPDNYWQLHRYTGEKEIHVIGQMMPPFFLDPEKHAALDEFLLQALNTESCFDQPIRFMKDDLLVLHFRVRKEYIEFAFTFNGKKWKQDTLAPFELENFYRKVKNGKVETTFII